MCNKKGLDDLYRYFISYQVSYGNGNFGFGHCESKTDYKITGIDSVRRVAKSIEDDSNFRRGSVILLNFKMFDDE